MQWTRFGKAYEGAESPGVVGNPGGLTGSDDLLLDETGGSGGGAGGATDPLNPTPDMGPGTY